MSTTGAPLFPLFLKLQGRPCLVVGGSAIAESKVESLLQSGANVTVVSPELTTGLAARAERRAVIWRARKFNVTDLVGVFLVIAATPDEAVNEIVFREAERCGILCNAADQPARCHFYFPAVVHRGALQIAISTAGLSPSLARRLREELELQFGPEYSEWVERLGRLRERLMRRGLSFVRRRELLAQAASSQSFALFRARQNSKGRDRAA